MHFQKISILSPRKVLEFPGGWGVLYIRPKNLKKCVKLHWNFQRGGVGLRKNPFCEGGMDIFWNYTLVQKFSSQLIFFKFLLQSDNELLVSEMRTNWGVAEFILEMKQVENYPR